MGGAGAVAAVLGTAPRRLVVVVSAVLGVVGGVVAVAQGASSFYAVTVMAQTTMSLSLPFLGAALGHAARQATGGWPRRQLGKVGAACAAAAVLALFGCVVAAVCTWVAGEGWGPRWGAAVGTSVAIQLLAQLVGTGLGLLVPRAWVAGVLTVVLPLGVYAALSGTAAQAWLTPYAALQNVLAPSAGRADWVRWLVVFSVWGLALNLAGFLRLRRRTHDARGRRAGQ